MVTKRSNSRWGGRVIFTYGMVIKDQTSENGLIDIELAGFKVDVRLPTRSVSDKTRERR